MGDFFTRLIDLPPRVNALVVLDAAGDYNIYINSKLSKEAQRAAFLHELAHIKKAHFYDDKKTAAACEREAK